MLLQKSEEGGFGVGVAEKQALVRHLCHTAGALKSGTPFFHLPVDIGTNAEKEQISASKLHELFRCQHATLIIVGGHTGNIGGKMTVDGDHGNGIVHLQIGAVGQGDDAVDLILLGQRKAVLFRHGVVVGGHEQAAITVAQQTAGQLVGQHGKEGMPQGWHHQGDAIGLVGF